ncbi:MAG: ThuA domain-containing protein [Planctomycetota bacterium]|jgi:type 1 glutamine amidotransferase/nicotinamidase-related amidase
MKYRISNKEYPSRENGRMKQLTILLAALLVGVCPGIDKTKAATNKDKLIVTSRSRVETREGSGKFRVVYKKLEWKPSETAIIICDMWNEHWCKGATRRVAEMAPYMNEVVSKARSKGMLIVHAPSGTIGHYKDHPARKRAQSSPKAANLPKNISKWCTWKSVKEKKAEYPIDQSDGGCDCEPKCKGGSPWRKQIETIKIRSEDAISDSGVEIWNLLEQHGIDNVILMGVHTNMCVLGRPFGLRNMARYGRNVVLMRDMTDTMYNSRMRPYVSHFSGTDLIVKHIEKFVCPTITSGMFTSRPQFSFKNDKRPRMVFISAESEYKAAESYPGFAHELEMKYGLNCEILQGSIQKSGEDRNYISGMETLSKADLVLVFVRRRAFQAEQMQYFRDYLERGKPLIGLRTASHAFDTRGKAPDGHVEWRKFDAEVLGGNYDGHYGSGPVTTVTAAAGAKGHPVLAGVQTPFASIGSLYEVSPLSRSAKQLLTGTIPNKEAEPVAWTNTYKKARVFYTSLGHPDDFKNPQFRRLLINAVFWAMNKPVPKVTVKAEVSVTN